ncbi:MAG TPA: hypothetical protein VHM91_11200 [Verrucomicrobiales bacterium]|nr:hypothetical protein [Verrucomicrobiales bacterium]
MISSRIVHRAAASSGDRALEPRCERPAFSFIIPLAAGLPVIQDAPARRDAPGLMTVGV